MNQKISTGVGVIIIIIIALTAGVFTWKFSQQNSTLDISAPIQKPKTDKTACTMEAKLCPDGTYVSRSGPNCEFAACPDVVGITDKIIITSPKTNAEISSPVKISGRAVGGWFFEASFPVEIHDADGKILGQGIAQFSPEYEGQEWMTEELVGFAGEIKFSTPANPTGYILFKKDNPSDLPSLEEAFKLPVQFFPNTQSKDPSWRGYYNEKLGFSLGFPDSWAGYSATESDDSVCFSFKEGHQPFCIFTIRKLPQSQWDSSMVKLTQDNGYVYACDGCCGQGETSGGGQFDKFQQQRCGEVGDVLQSFHLLIND